MYQLKPDFMGQPQQGIKRLSDSAFIPFDPANTDYQAYLKWLEGYEVVGGEWVKTSTGNEPMAAEEDNQ
jgi:hypothetical protein